jgi:tetratricopeptide (TPR) repeat protein
MRAWWAALVLLTVVAYAPAMRSPFLFDDIASIPANASIRQLWPPAVPLHPPVNTSVSGRPVVNYTLALNYWLNERLGVDQRPYPEGRNKSASFHLVNLVVHLCAGWLLFLLIRRTARRQQYDGPVAAVAEPLALVVSALWLLHPIQTEAVNYVIQRTELLVSLCYLGVLYAACRSWESEGRASTMWSIGAVAICLVGMGCKEVMITAPFIVALYHRAFQATSWREVFRNEGRWWFYPALLLTTLVVFAGIRGDARFGTVGFAAGMTWYEYLYSQAWAIAHYLRLVVWPSGLTFDYGQREIAGWAGVPGAVLLGAFAIATIIAWLRVERWGWFAFLGAWFFLLLAPSSSVVPITTEIAAERRVYLALAAICLLVVVACLALYRRLTSRAVPQRWFVWVAAGVCGVLALVTFARSTTYASSLALWRDTVRKAPTNPRAYHNLAAELIRQDEPRLAEAETLFRRAVALDSTYVEAYTGLATIAINLNNQARAESLLTRVLALDPGNADATQVLGRMYLRAGEPARALPYFEQYASAFPGDNSLIALGTAYLMVGRFDDGAAALREALRYNPARTDAMRLLGGVLAEQGKPREALPFLEDAVRAAPSEPLERGLLSLTLAQLGRVDDAVEQAHAAVSTSGGSPRIYVLAGRAMYTAGRLADADTLFSEAIRANPAQADAKEWLRRVRAIPR